MPTNTFYNLPDEKRKRLMDAVEREFTRVPFEQTSINRIVQDAGISRGSFYQYFESKDELFYFCVQDFMNAMRAEAVESVRRNKGDVFACCEDLLDFLLRLWETTNRCLLEHIMIQIHQTTDQRLQLSTCLEDYFKEREYFFNQIDLSMLNLQAPKDVGYLFDILINELRWTVFKVHLNKEDPTQLRREFKEKLNLLRRGLERKTEEAQ